MMIWRLLKDDPAPAAWNMAVDEALLLCHAPGSAPVLRFYGWNPPAISLGRFQRMRNAECGMANEDSAFATPHSALVRRPTGGRAIWHDNEITYSVVLREELLPREARSVVGSYAWLSRAFIAGLQTLGVRSQLAAGETKARTENCFASAARSDFVVNGRKLIGAAQCRKSGAILQHGSLLLDVDEQAWRAAIGGTMENTVSLRELGVTSAPTAIIEALCQGVTAALNADLQPGAMYQAEQSLAQRLEQEKYSQRTWNCDAKEP